MPNAETTTLRRIGFWLASIGVLVVTAAIYWPALNGPFLFDDVANLKPLVGWLQGWYGWQHVVFGNNAGLLGRPISMATFLLDAALTRATNSFAFKLTNLSIHLACGLAMLCLAAQVLRRWPPTQRHAKWFALALVAWWLWLPLNVDTVLYVVQRMAQLAALFALLALACYLAARQRIAQGKPSGQWLLWVGVPALTLLAAFSKENGVLALPLALVLEVFLFRGEGNPRPTSIKWFFTLTVGLPVLIGCVYVAIHPGFIVAGYATRPFTFTERLLTEPRVLWSYVQTLLVPLGPRMGFFQDNFPVSTGLLQPWTTLPAIAAWLALVIAAFAWRRSNPLFGAGVLFFLVGQALESSVFPLELYFEHRNYLPSFGVLLAVIGTLAWAWQRIPAPTRSFRRMAAGLAALALALLATATWGHTQSWRNTRDFYTAQLVFNPTSPRLQAALAQLAFSAGNLPAALQHIALSEHYGPTSERSTATLWRFLAYCSAKAPPPAKLYAQLDARAHGRITQHAMTAFEQLANDVDAGCQIDTPRLAGSMQQWLDAPGVTPTSVATWRTRYNLAAIVARSGRLAAARNIARRAWIDSGYNGGVGVFLFQLNGSLGDADACRMILARLERQQGQGDRRVDQAIASFRKALANGEIGPAAAASTPSEPPR